MRRPRRPLRALVLLAALALAALTLAPLAAPRAAATFVPQGRWWAALPLGVVACCVLCVAAWWRSRAGSQEGPLTVESSRRRLSVGAVVEVVSSASSGSGGGCSSLLLELEQSTLEELLRKGEHCIIGSQPDGGRTSYADKAILEVGDAPPAHSHIGCHIGHTCRKGLKPESPNQDSWIVLTTDDFSIYGVFDGHGRQGHEVSQFVKDTLPKLILRDERFQDYAEADDPEERAAKYRALPGVCVDAFKKMQDVIATGDMMKKFSAQLAGTSATVAIHDHKLKKLVLAHVADSTAVLGKVGSHATQLTRDHKPDLKDERARIEKAGGRVVFDGYANHRVYVKDGRFPGLNMSRCLGDLLGQEGCGLTCEPETTIIDLADGDDVLLVCSDGVWEFITASEAVEIVRAAKQAASGGDKAAVAAAEKLAKEAWDRWIREEGGAVVDDITVLAVFLDHRHGSQGET